MSPVEILAKAEKLGLDIHLHQDGEHIDAPDSIPDDLRREIIAEREGVLIELARREYPAVVRELDQLWNEIDYSDRPYGEKLELCETRFDPLLKRLGQLVAILGIPEEERLLALYEAENSHKDGAPVDFPKEGGIQAPARPQAQPA